MLVKRKY